jgi:hypothetical protein
MTLKIDFYQKKRCHKSIKIKSKIYMMNLNLMKTAGTANYHLKK